MNLIKNPFLKLNILLLLFLTTPINISAMIASEPEYEWKVNFGDSMTYTYSKYVDFRDEDGNGDAYSTTISNNSVEVVIKNGTQFICEIISLNEWASVQLIYKGVKLPPSESSLYVMKTVDNRTYWETSLEQLPARNPTIVGNLIISQEKDVTSSGKIFERVNKLNWKTGWIVYLYSKESNATHLIRELELTTGTVELTHGFDFLSILIVFPFIPIILVWRSRKKRYFI